MESNRGESPQFERPINPAQGAVEGIASVEATPSGPESSPSKQVAPTLNPLPISPDPALAVALPINDQTISVTSKKTTHDTQHGDRIEQQWVDRAKAIVAQTKDDPYKQKNEISQEKADYIQHRFNKVIKTNDNLAT